MINNDGKHIKYMYLWMLMTRIRKTVTETACVFQKWESECQLMKERREWGEVGGTQGIWRKERDARESRYSRRQSDSLCSLCSLCGRDKRRGSDWIHLLSPLHHRRTHQFFHFSKREVLCCIFTSGPARSVRDHALPLCSNWRWAPKVRTQDNKGNSSVDGAMKR